MRLARTVPFLQLSKLAWVSVVLLSLGAFGTASSISSTSLNSVDKPLRAAFVSLAHESDLSAILESIHQLEHAFNSDYQYHWVFFSTAPLSENFRRLTSNATKAACLYEVIPDGHWKVDPVPDEQLQSASTAAGGRLAGHDEHPAAHTTMTSTYRWNLGSFAREDRMKDYEWFWRVEPGAHFTHPINFDVFRFMHDNGIAYGFTESAAERLDLETLSPQIRSFIDKNPKLLHAEADVSWLMEGSEGEEEAVLSEAPSSGQMNDLGVDQGSPGPAVHLDADIQQAEPEIVQTRKGAADVKDTTRVLEETFDGLLNDIRGSSLCPIFELGSLAFLRSPGHQALMNHLEQLRNTPAYTVVEDVPAHTLSASMFLPKQSVWNFRKKLSRREQHPPTPVPTLRQGALSQEELEAAALRDHFAIWDHIVEQMGCWSTTPALKSGNTVIDDRNFVLGMGLPKAVRDPEHEGRLLIISS